MKRHDCRLGKSENKEPVCYSNPNSISAFREDSRCDVICKVERPGKNVGENCCRKQQSLRRPHKVHNILFGPCVPLFILVMSDKRVGKNRYDFIKQIQGEEASRKGDALGAKNRYSETCVISRLGMLIKGAHVADVIKGGKDPQK